MPSDDVHPDAAPAAPVLGRAGRVAVAPTAEAAPAAPGSPPWVVAALVAANLVPLVGVLFWGWSTFDLMRLYWLENGVIGVFTVLKMLLTEGPEGSRGGGWFLTKLGVAGFFAVHYGGFWVGHGLFVTALFGPTGLFGATGPAFGVGPSGSLAAAEGLAVATPSIAGTLALPVMGLVASHAASFVGNVLQRGEDLRTAPNVLMARPYGRVTVLHVTLVLGAFPVMALGEPIAALVLFVALKTVVDLNAHVRAHRSRPAVRGTAT